MVPVLGTLSLDGLAVLIPVETMGDAPYVRVDVAVLPGTEPPAESSHLWRPLVTVDTPSTVETPAQARGTTLWVRASARLTTGEKASVYTVPVSIDIPDHADFDALSVTLDEGVPVITWTPGNLTGGVRIQWAVHDPTEVPGSFEVADFDASTFEHTIDVLLDLGEAITVIVEAWDGFSTDTVTGEQGLVSTTVLVRPIPTPTVIPVRTVSTYEYTLQAKDAGVYLRVEHESGATLIVPEDATLTFSTGTMIRIEQTGAGPVTVVPEATAPSLQSLGNMRSTAGQYAVAWLTKVAPDTWTLYGDLAS